MTYRTEIGKLGENRACEYLVDKKFKIIERNYRRKWGELPHPPLRTGMCIKYSKYPMKTGKGILPGLFWGRISGMLFSFLRRWYVTRQLYIVIYRKDDITFPGGVKTSRDERISNGVERHCFIQWLKWKWEGWSFNDLKKPIQPKDPWYERLYYNLSWRKKKRKSYNELARETINDCVKLDYIEDSGTILRIGLKGREVYVWYYPFYILIKKFFGNPYVKAIFISIITIVTAYYITDNVINKVSGAIIDALSKSK